MRLPGDRRWSVTVAARAGRFGILVGALGTICVLHASRRGGEGTAGFRRIAGSAILRGERPVIRRAATVQYPSARIARDDERPKEFSMHYWHRVAVYLALALGGAGIAQAAAPEMSGQSGTSPPVVIKAARMIDAEKGTTVADAVLVVSGEKIVAFGPAAAVSIPSGARVIDLGQATVLPGLIDAHVHLTSNAAVNGYNELGVAYIRRALYGAHAARVTLDAGFTTVRNVAAEGY